MAIGNHKRDSIVAIMQEGTEGTYEVPGAATDYIQVEPDFSITPSRELLEREFITGSVGVAKSLKGMKSAEASLTWEARASANGGVIPEHSDLYQAAIGSEIIRVTNASINGSGSTTTTLDVQVGEGSLFTVGDMVLVLMGSGDTDVAWVTGISTDTVTVAPAMSAAPANADVVPGAITYKPLDTAHISLSLSVYWANEIREALIGGKVSNLSLAAWEVGQIAKFSATLQGLSYTRIDGVAPHTPTYVSQLPPVVLSAIFKQGNTVTQIKGLSLSIDQELVKAFDVNNANGATSSFVTKRTVSGTINPYMDDTTVTNFTSFDASTDFSLSMAIGNVDSSGDLIEGSVTGIRLPQCVFTENAIGDDGGLLIENLTFSAHRGDDGTTDEIFLGSG